MIPRLSIFEPPPKSVSPYVQLTFTVIGELPVREFKIIPDGMALMMFNWEEPYRIGKHASPQKNRKFSRVWVQGIQTSPVFNAIEHGNRMCVYGLRLEPAGLNALFGLDMRDLADQTIEASEILPERFLKAMENMGDTLLQQSAQSSVYQILADQAPRTPASWLTDFYTAIKESRGALPLSEYYPVTGRSPRYVNQQFKRMTGVTPKVLSCILRLDALLQEIDPAGDVNWAELAQEFGFYDQPHFNREFKKFTGVHPGKYVELRRNGPLPMTKGESTAVIVDW
jgi:AraC-like DNA-binding protein